MAPPGSCVCDAWPDTAGIIYVSDVRLNSAGMSVSDARPNSAGMSASDARLNSPGVSVSDARCIRAEVTRAHLMLGHLGLARRLPMLG